MRSSSDEVAYGREPLEVSPLAGEERKTLEVWDDPLPQVLEASHLVLERSVTSIRPDAAAREVLSHQEEHLRPVGVLAHREAGPHLPPHPELAPRRERDGETAFSIDET